MYTYTMYNVHENASTYHTPHSSIKEKLVTLCLLCAYWIQHTAYTIHNILSLCPMFYILCRVQRAESRENSNILIYNTYNGILFEFLVCFWFCLCFPFLFSTICDPFSSQFMVYDEYTNCTMYNVWFAVYTRTRTRKAESESYMFLYNSKCTMYCVDYRL